MDNLNLILLETRGVINLVLGAILVGLSALVQRNATNGARDVLSNFIFGFGFLYLTLSTMGMLDMLGLSSIHDIDMRVLLFVPMSFTVFCIVQGWLWVVKQRK